MASFKYTFQSGDTLTPARLNDARDVFDIVNADIANDTITNAKIKSDAAIAGTKISPDFGSQNVVTTGGVALGGAAAFSKVFSSIDNAIAGPQLSLTNNFNGNASYCPFVLLQKQRGTGAVQSADRIAQVLFRGHDGTQFQSVAGIACHVDGPVSSGVVPGRITVSTANSSGNDTERMRIDASGNVGIGTLSPAYKLDVSGIVNTSEVFSVDGTQVVSNRRTGWSAATGTATRSSFATSTVTTAQLAERVKALIDDLSSHGLIGT